MNISILKQQTRIEDIATHLLGEQVRGMYRYPGERTASIKLYPETRSFFDFGRAFGGDALDLWMHVKQCDLSEALQEIRNLYGIEQDDSVPDRAWIEQQRKNREFVRQEKERKQRAWRAEVDRLQEQIVTYDTLLNSEHVPPMCEIWCWCKNCKQLAEYRLDVLCGL